MAIQDNDKITCYGFNLNDCENARAIVINNQKEAVLIESSSQNRRKTPTQLKQMGKTMLEKANNNNSNLLKYKDIKDKCTIYFVD